MIDFKEIEQSALKLDEKHRAELAKRLLISLEENIDEDIEQAWIEEINRRKAQLEAGEVETIPGEQVLEKARNLLKK
ncbi:MAG TPA: addiction module protein [Balneolales bacterium]|nr:addiction module protein [Balneolales bacterium]